MTGMLRDRLAAVLGPGNDDTTAYPQADAVLEVLRSDGLGRIVGTTEEIKVPATSVFPGDFVLASSWEYADDTRHERETRFWVRRWRPERQS